MDHSRTTALLLVVGALLGACDPAAAPVPGPVLDNRDVQIQELRAEFDQLARVQATADTDLNTTLDAARAIDQSVSRFLDPATLYEQGENWDEVQQVVDRARFTDLRQPYIDVAVAADQARTILSKAEDGATDDADREYLEAQDAVLVAVRAYAEQADRVAQLLERHGDVYLAFAVQNQSFTERRFFFRTPEEAADAYATEIDSMLRDLGIAQQQLVDEVAKWRDAGVVVNDATLKARRIYESRTEG